MLFTYNVVDGELILITAPYVVVLPFFTVNLLILKVIFVLFNSNKRAFSSFIRVFGLLCPVILIFFVIDIV